MKKSQLYYAATAVLAYMLYIQITHLGVDLAFPMAAAIILGINVGWSLVFELLKNRVFLAAVVTPILLYGNWMSIEASQRAFAQKKHQTIMDQSAGPVASMQKTQMIIANNAMVSLSERGISSGPEYDDAMGKFSRAEQAYNAAAGQRQESAAAKALQAGDDSVNVDEAVAKNSGKLAWLLELMCVALAILCGLGTSVADGVMSATKKPRAQPEAVS